MNNKFANILFSASFPFLDPYLLGRNILKIKKKSLKTKLMRWRVKFVFFAKLKRVLIILTAIKESASDVT